MLTTEDISEAILFNYTADYSLQAFLYLFFGLKHSLHGSCECLIYL